MLQVFLFFIALAFATPRISKDEYVFAECAVHCTEEQFQQAVTFLEHKEEETTDILDMKASILEENRSHVGKRRALSAYNNCQDADWGATDTLGDDCDTYTQNPYYCAYSYLWNDYDFDALTMCCACGGGADNFIGLISANLWVNFGGVIEAIEDTISGRKDWCDCGKTGSLEVKAAGQQYTIPVNEQYAINWGEEVGTVEWKCSKQSGWEKASFGPEKIWVVKLTHEKKSCCKAWYDCGNKKSGRVTWF